MRIAPLAKARGVNVRWRPFLLGPIFKALGWDNSPFNLYPVKGRYMWRDLDRICGALALPFMQPSPFPQNTLAASRVAMVALAQDWGEDYCRAIYRARIRRGPQYRRAYNHCRGAHVTGKERGRHIAGGARRHDQVGIARADRGGATARHFRRAELRDARRRIVLGQRPAGGRARLGVGSLSPLAGRGWRAALAASRVRGRFRLAQNRGHAPSPDAPSLRSDASTSPRPAGRGKLCVLT